MSKTPNFTKLYKTRVIARKIKNEGFQREYKALVEPILYLYKNRVASDDELLFKVKEVILKAKQLANYYQYIPNHARINKKTIINYNEHSHLYQLEKTCESLLK